MNHRQRDVRGSVTMLCVYMFSPIPPPCDASRTAATERQSGLTKPPGSLGRLERLAVDIAAWQATPRPAVRPSQVLIFAADHPIALAGVSPYPQAVTAAMVGNFIRGGAASSVMARRLGVPMRVVDVGVVAGRSATHFTAADAVTLERSPVADAQEGDVRTEDAMTPAVFAAAIAAGRDAVAALPPETRSVILGEMGIGNSTLAAAVTSSLCDLAPELVTGPGTGATGDCFATKLDAVRQSHARVVGSPPLEILRRAGGRELAAIVGAAAAALARRLVVVADGFISTAAIAALIAAEPAARPGVVFSHVGGEPGHRLLLEWLGASPLLALEMALGEGTGGLAALPLLDLACETHNAMASFTEAGVPDRS
jgi:nicotinate-nucleotide--dimethylbenzimidazole phosphoribosyltransferase